ncbi:phenylalanine--tRNA ligase subunit alpha [Candidatus Phytoplasma palmae]|uniref:phenylalanine--tRNA ligase subunit alpha n=1 Tax=Candidatus Phytoplasma palmae TaxID=85624 RepID=UPI0039906BF9
MQEKIEKLENKITKTIKEIQEIKKITELEISYLGKNGYLSFLLKEIKNFNLQEDKKTAGKKINFLKEKIIFLLKEKKTILEKKHLEQILKKDTIDTTLPEFPFKKGSLHPLNKTIKKIENFFLKLGYSVIEGKEIVTDLYNFEMLNIEKDHPARDMQDSFYLDIDSKTLLRTHTSSVQIKAMLNSNSKPLKIISSGKVYRRDKDDETHSHQFTQLEGFMIDYNVNLKDLKQIIINLIKEIFGEKQKLRFRPSYFPFTKPSLEVDLIMEDKENKKFFLEIIGAGLIHPKVLSKGGYDPKKFNGFAFGIGIERITMLKYGIKDIRHFYNNDFRFLNQFIE